jgi:hypothetical protein
MSEKLVAQIMRLSAERDRLKAANAELAESLDRLCIEVVLSDVAPTYIDSHFRPHLDKARAALTNHQGATA